MVVALGALHTHAHKDLGHVLGDFERVGFILVIVRLRHLERSAIGSQKVLHHFVHRDILADLVGEPVVVQEHGLVADHVR